MLGEGRGGSAQASVLTAYTFAPLCTHALKCITRTSPVQHMYDEQRSPPKATHPGSLHTPIAGAAVTLAVLQGDILSVGGVGDCRAILDTGVDVIPLTIDHRINDDAREFRRLEEGGKPSPASRHTFTCLLSVHACMLFFLLQ